MFFVKDVFNNSESFNTAVAVKEVVESAVRNISRDVLKFIQSEAVRLLEASKIA